MTNCKYISYLLVAFIFTANSFSQTQSELRKLFNYDKGLELICTTNSTKDTAECIISQISYQGYGDTKLNALLIIPQKMMRQYPLVIFCQDNMPNNMLLLNQAIDLSHQSMASLLIDLPSTKSANELNSNDTEKDFENFQHTIIELRRSLDMLEKQSQIDPSRLAFVGFDSGAWAGAVLSGVETRISTYILSGSKQFLTSANSLNNPKNMQTVEQKDQYHNRMKILDPSNFLKNHIQNTILFQFPIATSVEEANYFRQIFSDTKDPKQQKTYKATFLELINFPDAIKDREKWLKNHL